MKTNCFERLILTALAGLVVLAPLGCKEAPLNEMADHEDLSDALQKLRNVRVFFGHQSVGGNILEGLTSIEGFRFPVLDVRSQPGEIGAHPGFFHAYIGRNAHPDEKISDFETLMSSGLAERVDIALMKFCYVDSGAGMSARMIFEAYMESMRRLEADYPATIFVYVTMPLTAPRKTPKNVIKRLLGMPVYGRDDNIERNEFNNLLRSATAGTGRLFDLAAIQSTHRDGTQRVFCIKGNEYQALVPEYTYDGGHLNEYGRCLVAEHFLLFLARQRSSFNMASGRINANGYRPLY